jgi:hypothetical protein
MENDNLIKKNLSAYFPELVIFIGDLPFDWDYIDNLFSKEMDNRRNKANGETIIIQATIYDIIVETKKLNLQAIRLLDFFNKLLAELSINLTLEEKKLIKPTIRSVLTAFDSRCLDFLGELLVLNNLMKSKMYKLEGVEQKLPNNKAIDFRLKSIVEGSYRLVEVVNIHLDSKKTNSDESLIRTFLEGRLSKKIADKKTTLKATDFFLVPVLWGGWKDIKIYSDYFKKHEMHISNVIEPVSYLTFSDPNDNSYVVHRFGNVSDLFNDN